MDNYKLLVVDDAFFIRNLIKKAVSNKPNTNNINISIIGEAKNANEAITFCETECPDIVTVDYLMPPGENGIELIKQLKEKYPNIMILMISDTTEIESNAIDLGCQFLVKPFKEEMIWKKLDNLILTKKKSNKIDSVIQEKNIVEKNEDLVVEDKTEFSEIVKPKKTKRKKKNTLDLDFEVAGSLDSIQIDTTIKPNITTEIVKEEEKEQVQNVKKDAEKEISEVKEEICSPIEQETEDVEEDDDFDFDFEFDEIDDEKDSNINHDVNKDTQIKEIETKEDKDFEDDEDFEFEFDDEDNDEDEIIENDKSNETVDESDAVEEELEFDEEELEFDEDDFEEENSKNDSQPNNVNNKKDDSCFVDESDDVFTFYEEDESEYEDKDIDKFKEESVVNQDIIEETEDRTDDDEIADLIKEASYSLDEDSKVIPEKSTNSTLNLLENDDDVFVSVDLSNSEEKKKKDIDTSDFDTMLDNFETSEEFKVTQDEIKHEEAFDEQLNSLDNFDFSLDDLEDTTIDLTTEDDYEESKSENETLTSDDLTTINFDNSDDSNLNIDIDEAEDIDLNESDDLNESNLDNEDDLFMNYDESDMNLFDDEDDLFDDEFSSKNELNSIDNSVTTSNKKDDYQKSFDLDSDDLLFEDENDEFDLDQTYKLNNNKEDNYNIEHNNETMKEETIDSLIDDAYEDSDIIPIFDTQEMSTSEIIKQNQKMRRKKNLQKDEMMYKKNMSKNHRPDGTKVKQKDSFFSRFFKEK